MSLEDALEKLAAWAPKKLTFPPTPKMVHESHALAKRLPDLNGAVVFVDVTELQKRFAEALANGTLDELPDSRLALCDRMSKYGITTANRK